MAKNFFVLQNNPGQYILQPMIILLTAPAGSGKTTSLIQWSDQNNVTGILTPVVGGRRFFMNAATKEQFPMEATGDEETLSVGKFIFSKAGFERAVLIIRDAIHQEGWLIIDEIGPLELRGEGFHDILKEVLQKRKEKIIIVVREGLASQVKDHFSLQNHLVITSVSSMI